MSTFDGHALTSSRTLALGGIQALLLLLLCVPLIYLQFLQRRHYRTLADSNRIVIRARQARRGHILDRNGRPLAYNRESFRLVITPRNEKELLRLLEHLKPMVDMEEVSSKRLLKHFRMTQTHMTPVLVKDDLSWEEVSRLSLELGDLDGILIEPSFLRTYPLGEAAVHMLGYTARPSEEEEASHKLTRSPYTQVGKQGIERIFESTLRGQEGADILELDARRQVIRTTKAHDPKTGQHVQLAIDTRLQKFVAERVKEHKSASVVVLNSATGEILAVVSHPAFDPHAFKDGIGYATWERLKANPYKPLINKPLQGLYAPGSTIKGGVVLAALEAGCISPKTRLDCEGVLTVGRHPFHCWMHRWGGHKKLDTHGALVRSCDVFMYRLGLLLGASKLKDVFLQLGLGNAEKLEGFDEARYGLVPDAAWKKRVKRQAWTRGDTLLMSIGQGAMLATPLELAVMAARLATGRAVKPTYLKVAEPSTVFPKLGFTPTHLRFVQKSLFDVVNTRQGTVYRWRIDQPGFEMAGKTGTSQVRRISLQERREGVKKTHERPWSHRDHALYIGYTLAQKGRPPLAVAVVVEHGGWGGPAAAPLGRDVLMRAQQLIQPVSA